MTTTIAAALGAARGSTSPLRMALVVMVMVIGIGIGGIIRGNAMV